VHPGQVAVVGLQAFQVGVDDLGVAVQAEQQGDVDRQPLTDRLVDGGHALGGGGDLDQQVGFGQASVQRPGGRHAGPGVVGQGGGQLQRDEPVAAAALVVQGPQHGQGAVEVGGDQRPVAGLGVPAGGGQGGELPS
jgi:hypothetical protein